MPELPEVETILRGLEPHLIDKYVDDVIIRQSQLRWPIPKGLKKYLAKHQIQKLSRRGKYLLIQFEQGTLIIHLGMSGSLRILTPKEGLKPHDHVDFILSDKHILRYNDPRRFGAILWTQDSPFNHPLLNSLGVEPLSDEFTAFYLKDRTKTRKASIKALIMNSKIVTGIGNIYAAEALFLAGIHPLRQALDLTLEDCERLVHAIKDRLNLAISIGGTTLKDFVNIEGKPGYFVQQLKVYGRANQPCFQCENRLRLIKQGQRQTVYCPFCQK